MDLVSFVSSYTSTEIAFHYVELELVTAWALVGKCRLTPVYIVKNPHGSWRRRSYEVKQYTTLYEQMPHAVKRKCTTVQDRPLVEVGLRECMGRTNSTSRYRDDAVKTTLSKLTLHK